MIRRRKTYKYHVDHDELCVNGCQGPARCVKCPWSADDDDEVYCPGCDSNYQQRCVKRICAFNCGNCSGGKHSYTPGCCGREPANWRIKWDRLQRHSPPDYAPESLGIKCRLIPVIYPQVAKHNIPEKFPKIDAWVVPIHKVADRKGKFRSEDLKDYLGLPSDRKLILSTCAPDVYQEMLWEKGPDMEYRRHGIDYWFPAHFSIYDDDSKMYQFASAKRQQFHAIWTESQFVWFRLGEHIPVELLAPIHNASSVLISTNQTYNKRNLVILHDEVKTADQWFFPETAFFIVGSRRDLPISNERTCYEINTSWLMRGLKGRNLAGQKEETLTPIELLRKNLEEAPQNVVQSKGF